MSVVKSFHSIYGSTVYILLAVKTSMKKTPVEKGIARFPFMTALFVAALFCNC